MADVFRRLATVSRSTGRARTPTPHLGDGATTSSSPWTAPSRGSACTRFASLDLTHEHDGKRDKIPAAPGERFVGLVLLFDIETLAPLAMIHDGYLQRMRVGATSALAADRLAREDSRIVGMIGAGWQAGPQIDGLREVLDVEEVRVYAPTREKLQAFAPSTTPRRRHRARGDRGRRRRRACDERPAAGARRRLARARTARGSVQGRELDARRSSARRSRRARSEDPTFHYAPGQAPVRPANGPSTDAVELGEVVAGHAGRSRRRDHALHRRRSPGLGIQFAAVAHTVYARRARGGRRARPTHRVVHTGGEAYEALRQRRDGRRDQGVRLQVRLAQPGLAPTAACTTRSSTTAATTRR